MFSDPFFMHLQPIYFTDMVRYDAEEERGGKGGRGKGEMSPGRLNNNNHSEEDSASSDEEERSPEERPAEGPSTQTYREAVENYYLHFSDSNLVRVRACVCVCARQVTLLKGVLFRAIC